MRNPECKNYSECLSIASRADDKSFNCEGCDEKTIFQAKKKRGRPRTGEYTYRERVYIDFTHYPELHQALVKEALKEVRSLPKQIIYLCKKSMRKGV